MREDSHCPCCGRLATTAWPAIVAPFITELVLDGQPRACNLLECDGCGFRFFDQRFTEAEVERLYGRYRGEEYFAIRHRNEPWYTRKLNDAVAGTDEVLEARKQRLDRFLRGSLDPARVESVLDYGGDAGFSMPDGWGKQRVVYDLSDAVPPAGVIKHREHAALSEGGFDLILLAHVLEHVADPADTLAQVAPLLRPRTGTLFVEVPYERFGLAALGKGQWTRAYHAWLQRHKPWLIAADFVSTAMKLKLGFLPPLGVMKLHEHVNFYDARSLSKLAERCGLRVLRIERGEFAPPHNRRPISMALLAKA